ncbi:restriction endonuclease subunit S [Eisenbergiella tayi]|uniref:restriction endonuclease subunit S n=1 Tax=Eisenbergiella tayi TaxID=1432052 RepID=UPI000AF9B0E2|nr:restriction endonuclease subunit S [Eisenbergiella tayi]
MDQISYFNKTVASKDMSGYYLLKNGEYAYNKSYSVGYDFGSVKRLDRYDMGALSTLYICFALKKHDSDFIKAYFDSLKWYREIYMISAEGARNHGLLNVPTDEFFDTKHYIPMDLAEQRKIADFMIALEHRIEAQQSLVDNLKKHKRGVVKALISGSLTFTDADHKKWETVSLAEIFNISAGGDIDRENSSSSYSANHPYPVFANALTNSGLYGYANYFKIEGDSITVSGRGEVGHAIARHCKYVPIVRLLSLVPKHDDDVDFFAYMINATSIYIESTGVPQLTSPQLGAVKVLRPPVSEQKRISSFLLKLDAKIEKEERLILRMEKVKASMLQQLFI